MWNKNDEECITSLTFRFGRKDISPPPFTYRAEPNKGAEIAPGTTIGTVRFGVAIGAKDVHYCVAL